MGSRWHGSGAVLAVAVLLLAGCGDAGDGGPFPQRDPPTSRDAGGSGRSEEAPPPRPEDAAALVERALAAREADNWAQFPALVSAAGKACPDPGAARRLGDVAAIAARWSSAVQDGRPKAQAVTEAQLAEVDWKALRAACAVS